MRKVAIITTTRGEYGIYSSVMDAIERKKDIEYTLVVGCMHLVQAYGYTLKEIEKDGRPIGAKVEMLLNSDSVGGQCKVMGIAAIGFSQAFSRIKPDIILVLGDRGEQLSAAIVANYMSIPVAHMHGGEKMEGGIDEFIRHPLTRFSHVHFPATEKSAKRIVDMGEEKWRVHVTGSCGIDALYREKTPRKMELLKKYGFNENDEVIMVMLHPITTEYEIAVKNADEITRVIIELNMPTLLIHSNADAGNKRIMKQMLKSIDNSDGQGKVVMKKSIPHEDYLGWLKEASLLITNSSSGVIEAPSAGIPVINVGNRQKGRECSEFVQHVDYSTESIVASARGVIADKDFLDKVKRKENPYDPFKDGKAGERLATYLAEVEIDDKLLEKKFLY